jgi:hypothetical protein
MTGLYIDLKGFIIYIYIYLTAIGLTPGGSSSSHKYTQTVNISVIQRKENNTGKGKLGTSGRAPSLQISTP